MLRALGNDVPVFTSLYAPGSTFPGFRDADVRPAPLNRLGLLRQSHRLALPLLAPAFSHLQVDAEVAICSSSGWAHGAHVTGRKIVYCYAPARWLYQSDRYASRLSVAGAANAALRPALLRWDRRAAQSAHRYLAISRAVRDQIHAAYGIEADIVPPPPGLIAEGPHEAVAGLADGFIVCVARLHRYKNVGAVVTAMQDLPREQLVVIGEGPEAGRLRRSAPANVRFLSGISDAQLRWLYAHSAGAVSAAYEDFGLVPVEAAAFAKPSATLRFGGFLDTIEEGRTGLFFDRPEPGEIAAALKELLTTSWHAEALRAGAARFAEPAFAARLREIVREAASDA